MNEPAKSTIFVAAALVAAVLVWAIQPRKQTAGPEDMVGQELFEEFDDPLAATSLEIVKFDESTATIEPFKVAQVDDTWAIPSHSNYPADAEKQLGEAAASLVGLEVLSLAPGETQEDHELYGVVSPDPKKLDAAATGVGTRVTMRDTDDKVLVDLIVGKEVPKADGDLRYVRRPTQNAVYVVELKTDKLSTKFEDWIEEDLLKLSSWDMRRVSINDYSYDEVQEIPVPRARLELQYNDTGDPRWELLDAQAADFERGEWVAQGLAEDEELDTTKLDDMRRALDNLKIVDVARKPEGLSADLKSPGSLNIDREALVSLATRGFHLKPVGNYLELFSDEGEARVLMKDGVEYVLRFGGIAGTSASGEEGGEGGEEAAEEGAEESDASGDEGVNRYLFVVAQFNPDGIEKPELEPLPEEKPSEEEPPAEEEAATEAETEPAEGPGEEPAAEEPSEGETGDEEASEEPSAEESSEESGEAEPEDGGEEAKDKEAEDEEALKAERERIEKENTRKQEEYEKKIAEGEEKVKELNDRFADWYYVISNEVYDQIHLGRDDIVKEKEKEEGEEGEAGEEAGHVHEEGEEHDHGETEAAAPGEEAMPEPESTEPSAPEPPAEEPSPEPAAETETPAPGEATETTPPAAEPAGTPEEPAAESPGEPAPAPSDAETPTPE
jgi:hypothetical protein